MNRPRDDEPDKITQAQQQVEEVVQVMRDNVSKVLERDQKLNDLGARASELEQSGMQFNKSARKLKKKYWWQDLKMKLIIGGVVALILIIVIAVLVSKLKGDSSGGSGGTTTTVAPIHSVS